MEFMKETKPYGRIIVNLNEQHAPLKKVASAHNIPMGTLVRDMVTASLERLKSGQDKINTNATSIQSNE